MADGGHLEKMTAKKNCGCDIRWTIGWIAYKFHVVVPLVISDNLINFWVKSTKNKMADGRHFEKNSHPKSFWAQYFLNLRLDEFEFYAVVLQAFLMIWLVFLK